VPRSYPPPSPGNQKSRLNVTEAGISATAGGPGRTPIQHEWDLSNPAKVRFRPLNAVNAAFGHKDLSTTEHYLQSIQDDQLDDQHRDLF
jgi:hypothetical protein